MDKLSNLKITKQNLYEQIVQQLQEMIINGYLRPGDKLPPERQMAEQLGVSRTVIREAFKTLENRGLVKGLIGDGTYVSQVGSETISESLKLLLQRRMASFEHLNEIRRMFEVEIVGLAAKRTTPKDIENMERAITEMEVSLTITANEAEQLICYIKADMAFHTALVIACQNPLLSVLLEPITDQLLEFRRLAASSPDAKQDGLFYHRKIMEKIKVHDVSGAQMLMREHLAAAEEWLSRAQSDRVSDKSGINGYILGGKKEISH
jgi:DNA-binding FadR family transcriptional regulator